MGTPRKDEARAVTERLLPGEFPRYVHPGWAVEHPWLVQGITPRSNGQADLDLRLFGPAPAGEILDRWEALRRSVSCGSVIHARQVHGREIAVHGRGPGGLTVMPGHDGHATSEPGTLLTISVADCVPVSVVAPGRAVLLVHAGWRGVADGIMEAGLELLATGFGAAPTELQVHLGPAICGACYEVGPEVHEALGLTKPRAPTPVDLRAVLRGRALAAGVSPTRVSSSTFCTRCGDSPFFSHRGGDIGRQVAVLGISGNPSLQSAASSLAMSDTEPRGAP